MVMGGSVLSGVGGRVSACFELGEGVIGGG